MSDKKYVVPEAMLEAVNSNVEPATWIDDALILAIILAAIRWLAENPVVPTREQERSLFRDGPEGCDIQPWMAVEWQRRMFLAPEPEVPDAVKDLLDPFDTANQFMMNKRIIEAYKRGKSGK